MEKVKFRGKCLDNGKLVYGHFWHSESFGTTVNGVVVDPDSVAQLVGYDEQGREVYEGDEVADPFNGETGTVQLQVQISGENLSAQNFFDNFYALKAIKADVLFSAPDLSNGEFQRMFGELLMVQGWFKFGSEPMFEVFQAGKNISICGYFTNKSFGYLQQVLDEYGIESIVNRVEEKSKHFSKLTDITVENSIAVEWREAKC